MTTDCSVEVSVRMRSIVLEQPFSASAPWIPRVHPEVAKGILKLWLTDLPSDGT